MKKHNIILIVFFIVMSIIGAKFFVFDRFQALEKIYDSVYSTLPHIVIINVAKEVLTSIVGILSSYVILLGVNGILEWWYDEDYDDEY